VFVSSAIGGIFIFIGYGLAIVGYIDWQNGSYTIVTWPVLGWVFMIGGVVIAIMGTVRCLFGHD